MDSFGVNEGDLAYEEELLRNPYQVKTWMRYAHHLRDGPAAARYRVYERALKTLPGRCELDFDDICALTPCRSPATSSGSNI